VLLIAGSTPFQVGPHPRDNLIPLSFGELELHVLIELLEALLAAELGLGRPEQAVQ